MMSTVPMIGEYAELPIGHIYMAETQIRTRNGFDNESIRQLADSIQTHGLMQPIVVAKVGVERYRVIAGHRRLIACARIKMQSVPALVRPVPLADDERAAQAVENLQRVDLALLDKAEGVAALVRGVGAKRAAKLLAKSPAWVSKHVAMTKLPAAVRALAEDGVTADLEILLMLRKIAKLDAATFAYLDAEIRAGRASRQTVIEALIGISARVETDDADAEAEGEGEGEGESSDSAKEKFGKLELAEGPARKLLAALEYAQKHKPSSRPGEELIHHVRNFIAKTWG